MTNLRANQDHKGEERRRRGSVESGVNGEGSGDRERGEVRRGSINVKMTNDEEKEGSEKSRIE